MQQPDISPVEGSFVFFEGSVVAAAGILQWCALLLSLPAYMSHANFSTGELLIPDASSEWPADKPDF
jgi:hypothetical protein